MSKHGIAPPALALALGLGAVFPVPAADTGADAKAEITTGIHAYRAGDFSAAAHYLRQHRNATPEVQYLLGSMYQHGFGVERDEKIAENLFVIAARAGNIEAQLQLGLIYLDISVSTASKWLELAGSGGNPQARFLQQQIMNGEFDEAC